MHFELLFTFLDLIGAQERLLLLWPVTISHNIDEESPLYDLHPDDLLKSTRKFEILVIFEGVTEETGNTMQARTSYLPNEILWGHRFTNNVVVYDKNEGTYNIHHSRRDSAL